VLSSFIFTSSTCNIFLPNALFWEEKGHEPCESFLLFYQKTINSELEGPSKEVIMAYLKVLPQHLPERIEGSHEKPLSG
jgi:hypothetical protein